MLSIVLSEGVSHAIQAELSENEEKQKQYLWELLLRIRKEDPHLMNFITNFAMKYSEDPAATVYACILVRRLLESQEQADELERSIHL